MPDGPKFRRAVPRADPLVISTSSIVSHRTGRGQVLIDWNAEHAAFEPEDARRFAHTILRECDNAESDAFIYSHFKEVMSLSPEQLAVLIVEFRRHRAMLEQRAGLRPTGQPVPEDDRR